MRFALLFILLLLGPLSAAAEQAGGFQTSAQEAILIDADTGTVLFEKNADKLFAPASMSKIMTLEILFKKLKAGEISLDTEFPVSLYAWKTGGAPSRTTSMFVPLNQKAKVSELILGITVQNANDACIAVAESLSGTDSAFAQAMTDEARALGLEKSTFGNSTGLPEPGQPHDGARACKAFALPDQGVSGLLSKLQRKRVQVSHARLQEPQPASQWGHPGRRPQDRLHRGRGLRRHNLGRERRQASCRRHERLRIRARAPRGHP